MDVAANDRKGLTIAFRIVAVLGGLLFVPLNLWFVFQSYSGTGGQEIHVVHNTSGFVSAGLLAGIPMLLLVWRPRQVALLRLCVAAGIAFVIGGLLGGVLFTTLLIAPIVVIVVLALSPVRTEVFRLGSPNLLLLAVVFICAIPAVVEALQQADLQAGKTTGDEHLQFFHYAGMAIMYLALVLAGAWSAFPARAVRTARWLVGLGGAQLAVVFLANPHAVSSVEAKWATGLLIASVVYLALGEVASRRDDAVTA